MEDLGAKVVEATRQFLAGRVALDEPLVVAVSGGSDSMALLEVVAELGREPKTVVASYDHVTRPEGQADIAAVRDRGGKLELPVEVGRSSHTSEVSRSEDALRRERYDFLTTVAARCGGVVLTGHTADDQAETVLAQLLRGAGPSGLRGVAAESTWPCESGHAVVRVLRPLLRWRRRELRELLQASGRPWREDPSNSNGSNVRGRLREEVLPLIAEVTGRDPVASLVRLAALATTWLEDLDSRLPVNPTRAELAALPDSLLDRWLHRLGCPTRDHVEWARAAIRGKSSDARDLPGGKRLEIREDRVVLHGDGPDVREFRDQLR